MTNLLRLLLIVAILILAFAVWKSSGPTEPPTEEAPVGNIEEPTDGSDEEPSQPALEDMTSDKGEVLKIEFPKRNDLISSPLTIKGKARGTWFFEASFPVTLTNWDGLIITEGHAEAQSDPDAPTGASGVGAGWMTEDFVPFIATIEFTKPDYGANGFLILRKDNPSGLPENDDSLEIPILFK